MLHESRSTAALSQSGEISPDFCCFYGGGIRHNEDIMHSFQNFIVRLIPNHPLPLETRIWKLVVRALVYSRSTQVMTAGLRKKYINIRSTCNGIERSKIIDKSRNHSINSWNIYTGGLQSTPSWLTFETHGNHKVSIHYF